MGLHLIPPANRPGGFKFVQRSPSSSWTIVHNMNGYPVVLLIDDATNETMHGRIVYDSPDQVTVSFQSGCVTGIAYLR